MAPTVCIKANLNYNLKMPLSLSPWGWSGKYRLMATAESLWCWSLSCQRSQFIQHLLQPFHSDGSFIFLGFVVCVDFSYSSNQGKIIKLKTRYLAFLKKEIITLASLPFIFFLTSSSPCIFEFINVGGILQDHVTECWNWREGNEEKKR